MLWYRLAMGRTLSNSRFKSKRSKHLWIVYQWREILRRQDFAKYYKIRRVPKPNCLLLHRSSKKLLIFRITKKIKESEKKNTLKGIDSEIKKDIHKAVSCNGCKEFPIMGNRYQCMKCENYYLCERCDKKNQHPHPFINIKQP